MYFLCMYIYAYMQAFIYTFFSIQNIFFLPFYTWLKKIITILQVRRVVGIGKAVEPGDLQLCIQFYFLD